MIKKLITVLLILSLHASANAIELDKDSNGAIDTNLGGTNSTTAAGARTNLGLVIGTNVLAPDGVGTSLTAINGENIQNDTIDDDSIDFTDVTCADLTTTDCGAITSSGTIEGATLTEGGTGVYNITQSDAVYVQDAAATPDPDTSECLTSLNGTDVLSSECKNIYHGSVSGMATGNVASISCAAGVCTVTTDAPHGLTDPFAIRLSSMSNASYDGTYSPATYVGASSFSIITAVTGTATGTWTELRSDPVVLTWNGYLSFPDGHHAVDGLGITGGNPGPGVCWRGVDVDADTACTTGLFGDQDNKIMMFNTQSAVKTPIWTWSYTGQTPGDTASTTYWTLLSNAGGDGPMLRGNGVTSTIPALIPAWSDSADGTDDGIGGATDTVTIIIDEVAQVTVTSTGMALANALDVSDYTNLAGDGTYLAMTGDTMGINATAFVLTGTASEKTTTLEMADDTDIYFGNDDDFTIEHDSSEGVLNIGTALTDAIGTPDDDLGLITIAVDTGNAGMDADQEVFEIGKGGPNDTDANYVPLLELDEDGDLYIAGTLSVSTGDGVSITGSNGTVTFLGVGDGQDEDLKLDFNTTANTIAFSSPTSGATELDFGTFQVVTTGDIMGGINVSSKTADYTVGTDDASEAYGTLFINGDNDAQVWTLPSAIAGMSGCFMQGAGVSAAVTVTPNSGDNLIVNGVAKTTATAYTSTGAGSDKICVVAIDTTNWMVTTEVGTWSE